MPELPDVTVYVEALERHVVGEALEAVRVQSPSLLKTVDPPLRARLAAAAVEHADVLNWRTTAQATVRALELVARGHA